MNGMLLNLIEIWLENNKKMFDLKKITKIYGVLGIMVLGG